MCREGEEVNITAHTHQNIRTDHLKRDSQPLYLFAHNRHISIRISYLMAFIQHKVVPLVAEQVILVYAHPRVGGKKDSITFDNTIDQPLSFP